MADQDLRYNILVDVNGEKQVRSVSSSAKKMDRNLDKASKTTRKMGRRSRSANAAVTELGRGISDAAFTPIGALNNFERFAETMGQTKSQAGSLGGAMAQLGKSLIGPAGISVAIGVVSFALTKWGDKIFSVFTDTNKATEATKKFRKELKNLKEEADQFSPQFSELRQLQQEAFPEQSRIEALEFQIKGSEQIQEQLEQRAEDTKNELEDAKEELENLEELQERLEKNQEIFNSGLVEGGNEGENEGIFDEDRARTQQRIENTQERIEKLTLKEKSNQESIRQSKKKQLDLLNKLGAAEAFRQTEVFKTLNALINQQEARENLVEANVDSIDSIGRAEAGTGDTSEAAAAQRSAQERIDNEKRAARVLGTTRENLLEDLRNSKAKEVDITKKAESQKTQAQLAQEAIRRQATVQASQVAINSISQLFGKSKAAAIATGTANAVLTGINTAKTMSGLGLPFPVPQILGGLAAAGQMAQVARMEAISLEGGGSGGGSGGGGSALSGLSGVQGSDEQFGFASSDLSSEPEDQQATRREGRSITLKDGLGNIVAKGEEEIESVGGRENLGVPI